MSLTGDVQVMELADLLDWAARREKTGTLHVGSRSTHKRLVLRDGRLEATSSNDPRDMLGQFLVRDGLLSEQQLFEALLQRETDRRLLGAILISRGLITPEQLAGALGQCAEETVYELFLWREGRFEFRAWELGPDHLVPLRLDLGPLIEEGRWRKREWQRMRERLPALEVAFRVIPEAKPPVDAGGLRLLEMARGGTP